MKKIFYALTALALAAGYTAQAQVIPNSGLDTWVTRNNRELPANWLALDDFYATYFAANNSASTLKTTDVHGGTYAAKLVNVTIPASGTQSSFVQEAYLSVGTKTGQYAILGIPIGGGIPCAVRPTQFQFYYKNTGTATDSAVALMLLTRTVSGAPSTVGYVAVLLPPVATYTLANIPIQYNSNVSAAPDSAHITFTSGTARTLSTTSGLFIDDVSFLGAPLAVRADAGTQALLTVAPNPSPGGRFVISSPDKPELAAAPLQVLDALGRTVVQQATQVAPSGQRELDLSSLSTGIYLLRLDSRDGTIVRQLTVK
ncbi:MAG: T9SS type A sorting domain-containing protein [Janthinobacterium lividum]